MFKILKNTIKHGYLIMLIVFFLPLKVNANALTLPQNTLDTIATGNGNLLSTGFSSYGITPDNVSQSKLALMYATASNNPVITGATLLTVDPSQYTTRRLTQEEIDLFSQVYDYLYTAGGTSVSWDNVYYVTYDNGVFNGQLYVDSNGNILNYSPSNNILKTCFDMGFGGSVLDLSDITNIYDDIYQAIERNNLSYNLTNNDTVDYFYYQAGSIDSDGNKTALSFYIPQFYIKGVAVPSSNTYSGGQINIIYFNDNAKALLTYYVNNSSNGNNVGYISNGTYTYQGYTYNHIFRIDTSFQSWLANNLSWTLEQFLNTDLKNNNILMQRRNLVYDSSKLKNYENIVSFSSINSEPMDISNNYYAFDEVANLKDKLDSTNWELNDSFSIDTGITKDNYPLVTDDVFPDVISSDNPFVSNVIPDDPAIPETDNPALTYPQDLTQENSAILDSFSNLQIPILSGVTKRFPFCIPWDIRDAISLLQYSPTAPAWNFDWKLTTLGTTYNYHFEGDLSDFDSLALIFRRLMLLAIILGLAFWSYKIFF